MKTSFYTESVLYWLARGVSALAQRLPPHWNAAAGAAAGRLFYRLFPSRRVVALANLRAAFGSSRRPEELHRIVRVLFENLGVTLMEIAAIPRIDRAYVDRWVKVAPGCRERLEAALAQGKGVIFLTGHFGNWELISITGALHGYPTQVLAREQGWPRLNRLLTRYRESKGCQVVTKGFAVRQLVQGLQKGGIIGILADQDGGSHGVLCPFLGRTASTAPGPIGLSLSTGAPILPVFMVRQRGPSHLLVVEEPLAIPEEGTMDERIHAGVAAYLAVLERFVRRHPEQWLWLHRRWKSTPERRILILSDGKAGHLNQSRGLAQRIEAAWGQRMSSDHRMGAGNRSLVSLKTVEVAFRSPLRRNLLAAVASVVPRKFRGGERLLRWALTPETARELGGAFADFCISCGGSTAAVNLLFSWAIRARPIHVTDPRIPSRRRFDLAVIPRHDRPHASTGGNLLVMDGALGPERSCEERQLEDWRRRLNLSSRRRWGLLLGGPTRGVRLEPRDVEQVVQGLLSAAEKEDAELLVTTSRRTPVELESWLQRALAGNPRCRLLALVNHAQAEGLADPSEAVPCILGLADAMVVSGDSISMVSEAAEAAKPVVVFPPRGDGLFSRASKYRRFLEGMHSRGKVALVQAEEVGRAVAEIAGRPGEGEAPQADPAVEFLKRWF